MNDTENTIILESEEADAIMPDGWADGADIFEPDTWTGDSSTADEQEMGPEGGIGEEAGEGEEVAPTIEQPDAPDDQSTAPEEAPTTEPKEGEQTPRKFKVSAKIDHQEKVVEVGEEDLPTLVQKSAVTDRVQAKLKELAPIVARMEQRAKAKGFDTVQAMFDADDEQAVSELVDKGVPDEIARDYIQRRTQSVQVSEPAPEPEPEVVKPKESPQRDFRAEVADLCAMYPEMNGKQIPDEVVQATLKGKPLLHAYSDYKIKQVEAKAATLSKENAVLKQNAAAAAKAPVRGVTGGGKTDTEPESDFEKGFDSDDW